MKDIKNYEGLYAIDENGKVWSYKAKKYLKQWIDKNTGYCFVRLHKNNDKGKNYLVHRILAETFIKNPNNLPTVDHIDRNKNNNCVENLRWADFKLQRSNQDDNKNREKAKERCLKGLVTPLRAVKMLDSNKIVIMNFESLAKAAAYVNGNSPGICKACKNSKFYKGYYWEYS